MLLLATFDPFLLFPLNNIYTVNKVEDRKDFFFKC